MIPFLASAAQKILTSRFLGRHQQRPVCPALKGAKHMGLFAIPLYHNACAWQDCTMSIISHGVQTALQDLTLSMWGLQFAPFVDLESFKINQDPLPACSVLLEEIHGAC